MVKWLWKENVPARSCYAVTTTLTVFRGFKRNNPKSVRLFDRELQHVLEPDPWLQERDVRLDSTAKQAMQRGLKYARTCENPAQLNTDRADC